jgi:hypothetical protein
MRVISLWQPWASLFVAGAKRIETRSWSTPYRGIVAVHASQRRDRFIAETCMGQPFARELAELGFNTPEDLPVGAILGYVELTDCLRMVRACGPGRGEISLCATDEPRLTPTERAFGIYEPGRWAWITGTQRRVLAEPIPHRGAQGLRELPDDIAARVA